MNEIKIFENFPVSAGFTTKPADGKLFRSDLISAAEKSGEHVLISSLVHGTDIAVITEDMLKSPVIDIEDIDGACTDIPGVTLTTTHGDCIPIYIYDPVNRAIGLAHAGWRGTLAGIASELLFTMVRNYGSQPENCHAYIGPGIGACCFEVSPDVSEAFSDEFFWAEDFEFMAEKPHIDLKGINAELLIMNGLENVEISEHCTCCEPELFYSYRRCKDKTRMLAYIKLEEK